jgi:polyferredoxin
MSRLPRFSRHHEVQRVRRKLETFSFPRLQMFMLVTLTGMAGFMASALFLSGGMLTMWSRYLAAFGVAYLVFLGLLWLWLRTRAEDWSDVPDFSSAMPSPSHSHDCAQGIGVHHGDFGGGGASGSFDSASLDAPIDDAPTEVVGEALSAAGQAEELAIPLIVIVFLATLLLSSLFLVWSAPTLFAELLVDGVLSASLYRRLRGLQTRHWVTTAIRRTAWPFAVTALIIAGLGWGMAQYAPGAHSIGEVVAHANDRL